MFYPQRPFSCSVNDCNASYRRKDHLNRHMLQHEGKLFRCPIENCNKEFVVHGNVSRHLREFHKDKRKCDGEKGPDKHVCRKTGCGKEFKYASQLQKHAESHGKFCLLPMNVLKFVSETNGRLYLFQS